MHRDEPAASVVRRVFEEVAAGKSQRALARALNTEAIPGQAGGEWVQGTLSTMLRNVTYIGRVVINGEEHQGTHGASWCRLSCGMACAKRWRRPPNQGQGSRRRPSSGSHLFTPTLRLACALRRDDDSSHKRPIRGLSMPRTRQARDRVVPDDAGSASCRR